MFFLAQDIIDRLLSLTLNWPTSHMTGCNTTNLAVFPMIYLLQPAARSSEISGYARQLHTLLRWISSF